MALCVAIALLGGLALGQEVSDRLLQLAPKSEPGVKLVVRGTVRDEGGKPVPGAVLRVFQTDARGWYTPTKVMDEPNARLQGYVRTGADGRYEVRTIRPGGYPHAPNARKSERIPAHIHFEVRAEGFALRRLQLVFDDDPRMTPYWREWAKKDRNPIAKVERGYGGKRSCKCEIVLARAR